MDMQLRTELQELVSAQEPPCVSLYLPLEPGGGGAIRNAKLLTAALAAIEQRLAGLGLPPKSQIQFLAVARAFADEELSRMQEAKGLALFLSSSDAHSFFLPYEVREQWHIGEVFYLSPLLPIFADASGGERSADALRAFEAAAQQERTALGEEDILAAAEEGRVGTLLLADDHLADTTVGTPGAPSDARAQMIDRTVARTLAVNGEVVLLPRDKMPGQRRLAAVLR